MGNKEADMLIKVYSFSANYGETTVEKEKFEVELYWMDMESS